jgi:hypothetical protein
LLCAFSPCRRTAEKNLTVIPAKAGIYRQCEAWIPAFPLLSGKMRLFKKMRDARPPENSTLPNRHPSESWDPVPLTLCKSLDPSFRWDDERFSHFCKTCRHFPQTAVGLRRNDDEAR